MTSKALQAHKQEQVQSRLFANTILKDIQHESRQEYNEMQEAFELLGWAELPDTLKIEIYEDIKFMVLELKGLFSSCDEYVHRRRDSIHFWVSSYQDGICTIEAAIDALKI